ncbi:hypothetical protein ACLK1S_18940 [Escherichia coli]
MNVQQAELHGVMVLAAQRIEMVTQRLNGTVINNKASFDFLSHGTYLSVMSHK